MPEQRDEPISPEQRLYLIRAFNAVEVLYSLDRRMTGQLAITFLRVGEEEHQTVSALAAKCGVEAAVMTRHLQRLGKVSRHGRPGLGLVTLVHDLYDRRERRAILTERGVQIARLIHAALTQKKPVRWRLRDHCAPQT